MGELSYMLRNFKRNGFIVCSIYFAYEVNSKRHSETWLNIKSGRRENIIANNRVRYARQYTVNLSCWNTTETSPSINIYTSRPSALCLDNKQT